jgi:hypothetical protein
MSKQITTTEMITQIAVARRVMVDPDATLVLRRPVSAADEKRATYPGVGQIGLLFWAIFVAVFWVAFSVAGTAVFMFGMAVYGAIVLVQMIRDVPGKADARQPLSGFDALLKTILVPLSLSGVALVFALVIALVKSAS